MQFRVNELFRFCPYTVSNTDRKRGHNLKKNVKVTYSRTPNPDGVVAVKKTTLKKKLMEKLFGTSTQVVVIVPGNTCGSITVTEFEEGGQSNAKIEKR